MRRSFVRSALFLALAAAPLAASAAIDATITQAQQLLNQQRAQAAYDLLAPLEDERAGDPDYDYVYGLAALETGKNGIAAFAFERCLAVDPRNGPCRVMMARAHIAMGEHKSAREELETVQSSQPPAEVQNLVAQYLGVVKKRETSEKRRIGSYAQLGLGYDSNVTGITADSQIAVPGFGAPLPLTGTSSKQEDLFLQAEAGTSLEYVLNPAWSLLADASLSTRRHDDADLFDNTVGNVGFGAARRAGDDTVSLKLQAQDYRLDDESYRNVYGLSGQYQHAFAETSVLSLYTQLNHLDYHLGSPDAERYTLGSGYSRALEAALDPVVYAGLYVGQENSDGQDFLSQDFYGLRLGGSLGLSEKLRLTGSLSVEQRDFDGQDPIFLETREDTAVDASLGALYRLTPKVGLRPTYTYLRSDSNIVLSDYDRHVVSLDVRFEM